MSAHEDQCSMVFVVGNSRSGTTIMARLLGRHSRIHTVNELHFFEELWSGEPASIVSKSELFELVAILLNRDENDYIGDSDWKKCLPEAVSFVESYGDSGVTQLQAYRDLLLRSAKNNNKLIACEHTPRNVFYLGEIIENFPSARVVIMVRDPRAVLLSQKNRWRIRSLGAKNFPIREVIRSWANYHPITTTLLWNSSVDAGMRYSDHPRVRTVLYESLVADAATCLQEICAFLGVPFESVLVKSTNEARGVSSFKRSEKVGESAIDQEPAYRWQRGGLNAGELYLCQRIGSAFMDLYGYERIPLKSISWLPSTFIHALLLPFQLAIAVVLNFGRHKNLLASIRRRIGR